MEDLHESKSYRLIHIMKALAWMKLWNDTISETGIIQKDFWLIKYTVHGITGSTANCMASGCQDPSLEGQALTGETTNMLNIKTMLIGSKWSVPSAWPKGVTTLG